jgi:hypothetical protein
VTKQRCSLATQSIDIESGTDHSRDLKRIGQSLTFAQAKNVYPIFESTDALEPAEASTEDVLISIGDLNAFVIGVKFTEQRSRVYGWLTQGRTSQWISSVILSKPLTDNAKRSSSQSKKV